VADSREALWNNRAMSNRYWIIVAVIAIAAAGAGAYIAHLGRQADAPVLESGTLLPTPKVLADFDLVDTTGAPASLATLRGHPTLVFFGFTHCPDVCPTTLLKLARITKAAAVPGLRVVFVTVDPARDTPEALKPFVARYHPRLLGLTGTPEQIAAVAKAYVVTYNKVEGSAPDRYLMAHSQLAFLMDPDGKPVALLPLDDPSSDIDEGAPDKVAAELAKWVK